MSAREMIGLVLLVVAMAMAPFGYWVNVGWYLFALVLALIGGFLFFTARNARKLSNDDFEPHIDPPVLTKDLRGFPGARAFNREASSHADDIDGD